MQIISGGINALNSVMGGIVSSAEVGFFRDSLSQFQLRMGQSGIDLDQSYLSQVNQVFDQYNSVQAISEAKVALGKATGVLGINAVQELTGVEQWQMATPVMQGWMMANPYLQQLYIDGKIDGYSDSWEMTDPGVGLENQKYRQVMNGALVTYKDEDGEDELFFEYHTCKDENGELIIDEIDELTSSEQFMIRSSWRAAEDYLRSTIAKRRKDITNPWGNN